MRFRRWYVRLPLIALFLGGALILAYWLREPRYNGRTLSSWLQKYSDATLDQVQTRSEAEKAVQSMGADQTMRHLLDMAEARDGPIRSWVIRNNQRWNLRFLNLREAAMTQLLGIAGFEILGTNCAGAVPELTRLMQNTNCAFTALQCLVGVGKPAEIPICEALTNKSPEIRRFAASQLAWVTDDIDEYLERLKVPLNDADATVRFAAVQALGLQEEYPKEVIPLLVKALGDSQESVSGYAAKFLGDLGTNGLAAFPALSKVVESGSGYMASHCLTSLVTIDPDRAMPVVFAWLRSTDPERRAHAAWVLRKFPTATPEVLIALKTARQDVDSKVAHNAIDSLREYRVQERQGRGGEIVFAGEASYGGRQLGDWLKRRADSNEMPQDAQEAIRRMGTNAIPALLARLTYVDEKFELPDDEVSVGAVGGFYALGEKAASALPTLEKLVNGDDRRLAMYALMASCNTGTSCVPLIISALTNRHCAVRSQAVSLFGEGTLSSFEEARKNATPQILALLNDPEESVRVAATNALTQIDPGRTPSKSK